MKKGQLNNSEMFTVDEGVIDAVGKVLDLHMVSLETRAIN